MFIFLPKKYAFIFFVQKIICWFVYGSPEKHVVLFANLAQRMWPCFVYWSSKMYYYFLHSFLKVLNLLINLAKKYMLMFCLWTFQNNVIVFYLLIFQNIFTLILLKDLPNSFVFLFYLWISPKVSFFNFVYESPITCFLLFCFMHHLKSNSHVKICPKM